uniref:Uncharacterized protein n=1 Tax=Lepeophtheirus salmonis TaxID=72036 RepID=A0A0K2UMX2_LEPSM
MKAKRLRNEESGWIKIVLYQYDYSPLEILICLQE